MGGTRSKQLLARVPLMRLSHRSRRDLGKDARCALDGVSETRAFFGCDVGQPFGWDLVVLKLQVRWLESPAQSVPVDAISTPDFFVVGSSVNFFVAGFFWGAELAARVGMSTRMNGK